jgi:ATP-binding cassette, subfamily B, bacterial
MIERLRARPEWKFFGILVRADRTLAVAWWAVLVLRGLFVWISRPAPWWLSSAKTAQARPRS